ncbi:MAG: peptidoglycan DD-metalloendopeptidase family protein, partial [Deltaproteobacteria bacterium]|nr:peptidoglycan DD-metalloendopeptidase family protein [Deltaproteobacteria bacterium]
MKRRSPPLLATFLLLVLLPRSYADYAEPVNNLTLSGRNDYGTYNYVISNMFHTGMDIVNSTITPSRYTTPVYSSDGGIIHKIFGLNADGTYFICGAGTSTAPSYDANGGYYDSKNNHGFGMTVMVRNNDGKYSLYGHLNCINSGITPGASIQKGEQIGILGNSAFEYRNCDINSCGTHNGFGAHLHFEVKSAGVLFNYSDSGDYFSYTPLPPSYYIYFDPVVLFNASKIVDVSPFPIKVNNEIYLRSGPGVRYGRLSNPKGLTTDLPVGSQFVVFRRANVYPDACATGTWYQIHLPSLEFSTNNMPSDIDGWVCSDLVSSVSSPVGTVTNTPDYANVRYSPTTSVSNVIGKVWDNQEHVYFQSQSGTGTGCNSQWYNIYLQSGADYSAGWVCGDYFNTGGGQTLSVNLSANPSTGNAPLNGVNLNATISGTAAGPINYTFYCNRPDSGTNITYPNDFKIDGINPDGTGGTVINQGVATGYSGGTNFTVYGVCNYSSAGTYTAKVIAERGALAAEARTTVTVTTPPVQGSLSVTPVGGLTSSGIVGGPFTPVSQSYTLTNPGGSAINWTTSNTPTWVTVSPMNGTLLAGASATVTVSIN